MGSTLSATGMERAEKLLNNISEASKSKLEDILVVCIAPEFTKKVVANTAILEIQDLEQRISDLREHLNSTQEEHSQAYKTLVERIDLAYPQLNLPRRWSTPTDIREYLQEIQRKIVAQEFNVIMEDLLKELKDWLSNKLTLKSLADWNAEAFFTKVERTFATLRTMVEDALTASIHNNPNMTIVQRETELFGVIEEFKTKKLLEIWAD